MANDTDNVIDGRLAGRHVVVTRARHQQEPLTSALRAEGASVVSMPLIDIVESPDGIASLRALLVDADEISWIVVTSPNGARVVGMLHESGCSLPPVAAVGAATADTIGHGVDFISRQATSAALVDGFPTGPGRVIVVQGERADDTVSEGLAKKAWSVTRCDVYRTIDTEPDADVVADAINADAVVLASPSAVGNWTKVTSGRGRAAIIVIGPVTRSAAETVGLAVDATADDPSVGAIVDALVSVLSP